MISGQRVRQLNVNSEDASMKNVSIANSAKIDLLSTQKPNKLDKLAKKKKRATAVPMTTAVNDASKTIDESRIEQD